MSFLNFSPPKKLKKRNVIKLPSVSRDKINKISLENRNKHSKYLEVKQNEKVEIIGNFENSENVEIYNRTDISKKYMDFDSTYRNRNQYPNPCDYSVPIYNSSKSSFFTNYYENFIDLIDDSTPISNSLKPYSLNRTGYSPDALHIQLDSSESNIPNFYVNSTIEIDGDFRNVLYYDNVTKQVTIDRPFVAIPPTGRPYIFRKFSNFFTANVTPVNVSYPPGQTIPIVNQITGYGNVNTLSILSSNITLTKQLFQNSIIRFLNGTHKQQTSSVTSFEQIVPNEGWVQPDVSGNMELVSYYNSKGLSFVYTNGSNYLYIDSVDLRVYSSQTNRLLLIEIISGDLNNANTVEYYRSSHNVSMTSYTEQTVTIYFNTPIVLKPNDQVNVFIQDITDSGNSNGFLNLVGNENPNIDIQLLGFNSVPYMVFNGYNINSIYQLDAFGNDAILSKIVNQGIRIYNNVLNLPLFLTVDADVFHDSTIGTQRKLQVEIIEGENLNNTAIYTNTITLNDTSYTPINTTLFSGINISNYTSAIKYFMYSPSSANLIDLPNGYNTGNIPCSYIVPSTFGTDCYLYIVLTGTNNGTTIYSGDITIKINNSGTNETVYSSSNVLLFPANPIVITGSIVIQFKIDNILNATLLPGQNLDILIGINSNIDITGLQFDFFNYYSDSNILELYEINRVGISGYSNTFANTNTNTSYWMYSGAFNSLPYSYNSLSLPASYTVPADYVKYANMKFVLNGFSLGILNANDIIFKINQNGTSTNIKTFYNTSASTNNFCFTFEIVPNDNITFTAGQNLDFILGINTQNTITFSQLNVELRYIDTIYYTGPLVYLNPNSYYTVTFKDVSTDNEGFINLNGYTSAPEENNQSSLITTNFNGVCPSLKINSLNIITSQETVSWDNFSSTDFTQSQPISINSSYPQYVIFLSNYTGNITSITLNLLSFCSSSIPNRTLQIKFYDATYTQIGATTNYSITTSTSRKDYIIPLTASYPSIINGNVYSFSILDVTGDSNQYGYIYVYGTSTNYEFTVYQDIFPRFMFNLNSIPSYNINNSLTNVFAPIPISSEAQFQFVFNQQVGVTNPFLIALSSFSSMNITNPNYTNVENTSLRTITIRFRQGTVGSGGPILYQRDYILQPYLEPTILSIFLSDLSLTLTAGQQYILTLQDTTSGGNSLGYTWYHGITAGSPYFSSSSVYPLLYFSQIFYYITIFPSVDLSGFLNNGQDQISFNSLIRENSRSLNYRGLPYTEVRYFEVRLKQLIMPNKLLKVGNGGTLDRYPFFYVEIFNEGDKGTNDIMISNNNNQNVIFKVYITKTYYDQPTSFFVLKTYDDYEQRQIFAYRPDKDTRIRILMPDGVTVVQYQEDDYLSPSYPNPLLQTNIFLSIRPVINFKPLVKNDFVELFE
jgi:hypothetical protein